MLNDLKPGMEVDGFMAIRFAISQFLALSKEFRLICLTVIPPEATSLDHLVRLRHWVAPLGLPTQRLSLHAVESSDPDLVVPAALGRSRSPLRSPRGRSAACTWCAWRSGERSLPLVRGCLGQRFGLASSTPLW
jgi:hypothetical protein